MTNSEWISIVGVVSGLIAFIAGLSQYMKAQKWKRAEFVAAEFKQFMSKPAVKNATLLLDWNSRVLEIPNNNQSGHTQGVLITDEILASALVPHDQRPLGFTDVEVYIRDTFDELLEALQIVSHYIDSGLVTYQEFKPYIFYWIEILGNKNCNRKPPQFYRNVWSFIDFYGYAGVQRLCKGYGFDIAPAAW